MPGVITWEGMPSGGVPDQVFAVGGNNGPVIWCQNPQLALIVAEAMNQHEAEDLLELTFLAAKVAMASDKETRKEATEVYKRIKTLYDQKARYGH